MLALQNVSAVELRRRHQNDGLFCDPELWCAAIFVK